MENENKSEIEYKFKTAPFKHQLEQFEKHKNAEYFFLFNDMGTGKTKIVIDIAAYKYMTKQIEAVLIIAPNHVQTQWIKEEFPKHCPIIYRKMLWRNTGAKYYKTQLTNFIQEYIPMLKVFAVNVEAFQSDSIIPTIADYVQMNKVFIVIDEATRIKTPTAKRTKTIHKLCKYGQRCILTGTPTAKSPFDLWSMFQFLKSNYFDCNYFIFQHRYGILMKQVNEKTGAQYQTLIDEKTYSMVNRAILNMKESRNGQLMPDDYLTISAIHGISEKNVRFIENNPSYTRYKRLDELNEIISKDGSKVKKEDCFDLPEKIYEKIYVDMNDEQARVYTDLKKELLAYYADKELTVANKVALTTRLMQITGGFFPYVEDAETWVGTRMMVMRKNSSEMIGDKNVKLEALLADLAEIDDKTQLIVWAHFKPELEMLHRELNKFWPTCLFYGGTSDYDRTKIKEDFVNGKYRIFVGNTQTAGFGLNLQVATLQFYFSNTFRTEERLQAEDRSHRYGVKSAVVYKDIVAKNTIDEKIFENLRRGKNLNDFFTQSSLKDLLNDDVKEEEV